MKKYMLTLIMALGMFASADNAAAQRNSNRLSLGIGLLYENGLDATLSYEHEMRHHNAMEYFVNGYLKWDECETCHHVCPESFWHNYNTWTIGAAYKPCVKRGKNNYGNFRIGGSIGSDTDEVIGGLHLGYEHNYVLRGGWQMYWQIKADGIINGKDTFRTGIVLGFKLPTN